MNSKNNELEKKLWEAAEQLRANSELKSYEFAFPVLGLIFLKYADYKLSLVEKSFKTLPSNIKIICKSNGVLYLTKRSRFSELMKHPQSEDIGQEINNAMSLIESENYELMDILPKNFNKLDNSTLFKLMKILSSITMDIEGDVFGKIYEYFLGKFAMSEGRKGGEFFTPVSIVKLIVEIIEPFQGRLFDPACGSGGMFIQSARFISKRKKLTDKISIHGQEKNSETVRLCKMNLAIHCITGDIRQGNTYYEDLHGSISKFDFVMANPPFNVNSVDKEKIKNDQLHFPFGLPNIDNANYLWIQLIYSALNDNGRAGFVMANSASYGRTSELEIRKKLIKTKDVDVIISIGVNFFYTVSLSCTLWFLDKGKKSTDRADKVLFIDASKIYEQIDRIHRGFTDEQVEFLANIVKLYRDENLESFNRDNELFKKHFLNCKYIDIPGFCKVASIEEIEDNDYSLDPSRYVGYAKTKKNKDHEYQLRLKKLHEELEIMNSESKILEDQILKNISRLIVGF